MEQIETTGIHLCVIKEIKDFAQKYGMKQVILFGSRARGDYERASDIDLAVLGGNIDAFTIAVKEETSTLLEFDVIDLSQQLQEGLLESVRKEGLVIYEKV